MPASDPERARRRRILRPWRWAFFLYSLALTTGTHWPRLRFGPEFPATDKTIHTLAFAMFTFLLWRTQWIRSRWLVVAVAMVWSVLDELSQGIPALGRSVSWLDITANVVGVLVMGIWLWAARPIGGDMNRMRLRLATYVMEEVFAIATTWWVLIAVVIVSFGPLFVFWNTLKPNGLTVPTLMAIMVGVTAGGLLIRHMYRSEMRRAIRKQPCVTCSTSCRGIDFGTAGIGECPACSTPVYRVQWSEPTPPPATLHARLCWRPIMLTLGLIVLVFALLQAIPLAYGWALGAGIGRRTLPNLARTLGTMPESLVRIIDLGGVFAMLAVAVRFYRRELARHYDRPWQCAKCAHDLRGTPAPDGRGRCGECGARFVRMG